MMLMARNGIVRLRATLVLATTVCFVLSLTGCSMLSTTSSLTEGRIPLLSSKPEFQVPRQMVPVWTDTILYQADKPATRGFGGRILFYGKESGKAVQTNGTLIVYAWHDADASMDGTPDRRYVFPREQLQAHLGASDLGPS